MSIVKLALLVGLLAATTQPEDSRVWQRAEGLPIEGRGWADPDAPFVRLPARIKEKVRPQLWDFSRHSSGLSIHFSTKASTLAARWKLTSKELGMKHMPATGMSGLDLYVRRGDRWVFVSNYQALEVENKSQADLENLNGEDREYRLYLPLYNGVESLELAASAELRRCDRPVTSKPIVVYGTSIGQGACASRPGMAWPSIVGRELDCEVINLSFAGNGRLDPEIAELMAELESAAFVLDPLWNVNYETPEVVSERATKFIAILRATRPQTPIVMIGETNFRPEAHPTRSTQAFQNVYETLKRAGDAHLHWISPDQLFGSDREATVDGIHPSDIGMQRQAEIVSKELRPILMPK